MKYSSRLFLWGPFVLLLALAIGVSARWWAVAGELSKRLDAMNGKQTIPGVTLRFASKTVGGFPFRTDAVFQDFELKVAGPHGPITWRAGNFAAHSLTYGRSQWIFEAAGKQRLAWTTRSGEAKGLQFVTGSAHASAVIAGEALERFDLDIIGFDSPALAIARTQLHVRRNPATDQLDVVASAEELKLSPRLSGVCGDAIGRFRLEGDFSNASSFRGALAGIAKWQAGFDDWHRRGGRLFVAQSEFDCSGSGVFTQGQIGLDEQRRPRGLLTAQISGFERLRESAMRRNSPGTFVGALLDQQTAPNPAREGRVTVRAALRDGVTYLGNTPAGLNDPLY